MALWDARDKWYNIGIQLDMAVVDLEVIRRDQNATTDECMTEMLIKWLRNACNPPTWKCIVNALRSPTVSLMHMAETVEHNHLSLDSKEESDSEISNKTHQAAEEIKQTPGEASMCTQSDTTFQHIREFHILTDKQKEQFEAKLEMDSENIQFRYYTLRNKFFESLETQRLPLKKVIHQLKGLKALKRLRSPRAAFAVKSYEAVHVLESIQDIERVKKVIEENSSFFDFRSLEYMIENVGLDSDKKRLEKYKEEFERYVKQRIFECPPEGKPTMSPNSIELFVKLESDFETLVELKQFQCQLSFVLEVSVHVLRLSSVKDGCVEMIFFIPTFVQETTFPLLVEQEDMLIELGVIKLSCGDYHFPQQV